MGRNSKGQFIKGNPPLAGFKKGRMPWNKGLKTGLMPKSAWKKGQWNEEKHPLWKGDEVGYPGIHRWVGFNYGKAIKCKNKYCIYPRKDIHGKLMLAPKAFQWANLSHKYKRDISDWVQLCVSCHRKYDLAFLKGDDTSLILDIAK